MWNSASPAGMFMEGAFRRQLSAQIALRSFEQQIAGAQTPEDCWVVIKDAAKGIWF